MFAKVFAQILDSSLAEDYRVRLVFEDFLKLSDSKGIVDMTPQSIARRTNVPLEIVTTGIAALESPDPSSRTPDEEGRRIVRMDAHRTWGWRIVNFEKYRQSASKEMLRLGEAERKKAYREKFPHSPSNKKQSTEAEAEQSRTTPGHVPDISRSSVEIPTETEFLSYCKTLLVAEWYARDKFLAQDSKGWQQCRWRPYAARVKGWFENDGRPMKPGINGAKPKPRPSVP
jgi:hypothetical protein